MAPGGFEQATRRGLTPRVRSMWQASCTVTVVSTRAPRSTRPSTSTRYWVSSYVRAATAAARSRQSPSRISGYQCRTIAAHDPDGVTTASNGSKTSTKWRARRAGGLGLTGVEGGLAAARLGVGELDRATRGLEHAHGGDAGIGEEVVGDAGDEQRHVGLGRHQMVPSLGAGHPRRGWPAPPFGSLVRIKRRLRRRTPVLRRARPRAPPTTRDRARPDRRGRREQSGHGR